MGQVSIFATQPRVLATRKPTLSRRKVGSAFFVPRSADRCIAASYGNDPPRRERATLSDTNRIESSMSE